VAIEDAYELAYREAVRALEHQQAALAELRGRASLLLAAASISISVLGHGSATGHTLVWLAILCFASLSLCVLAIVWPHADGSVDIDPQTLLTDHLAADAPDAMVLSSELVAHIGLQCRTNVRRLARMSRAFRIGACLLAIQLVLTVLAATVTV